MCIDLTNISKNLKYKLTNHNKNVFATNLIQC